jgi:aspartyl-tRNA synthetase
MVIVYEGTPDEYRQMLKDVMKEVIQENESKRVSPLTYTEACNQLGITNKTLMRVRTEMNLTDIYQSDILRILVKYPKYIKKAKAA